MSVCLFVCMYVCMYVCVCVCVCMFFRLTVLMERLRYQGMGFHENKYLSIFLKSVEKLQLSWKSNKNTGHFTRRPFNIYISLDYPYLLTYSREQSPSWEANKSLQLVKKFPTFLWNPKVLHRTHKCPPTVPILSQLHPVPTTLSNFLKFHLNIILPSTSGSPQWSHFLRFPH
jgi:hypothetical protein